MTTTQTSSDARVRELYDDSADQYAEMMDREIDLPIYAELLSRLADGVAELEGTVVDTSCGPGHLLSRYRERYDSERQLVGIDLSARMVASARARLGPEVEVLHGDMRKLEGVETSSSAAVLSFFALHHITPNEALAALEEWLRILRPGGRLVLATWEGSGAIDYGGTSEVVALRYTKEQVAGWVRDAGFSVDRCVVEPVEGLAMNAIYLEGSKGFPA